MLNTGIEYTGLSAYRNKSLTCVWLQITFPICNRFEAFIAVSLVASFRADSAFVLASRMFLRPLWLCKCFLTQVYDLNDVETFTALDVRGPHPSFSNKELNILAFFSLFRVSPEAPESSTFGDQLAKSHSANTIQHPANERAT